MGHPVAGLMTQAECLRAIDRVRECSSTAPVINVVYLDRAVGEPSSQNEVDRLVDSLRHPRPRAVRRQQAGLIAIPVAAKGKAASWVAFRRSN